MQRQRYFNHFHLDFIRFLCETIESTRIIQQSSWQHTDAVMSLQYNKTRLLFIAVKCCSQWTRMILASLGEGSLDGSEVSAAPGGVGLTFLIVYDACSVPAQTYKTPHHIDTFYQPDGVWKHTAASCRQVGRNQKPHKRGGESNCWFCA